MSFSICDPVEDFTLKDAGTEGGKIIVYGGLNLHWEVYCLTSKCKLGLGLEGTALTFKYPPKSDIFAELVL